MTNGRRNDHNTHSCVAAFNVVEWWSQKCVGAQEWLKLTSLIQEGEG